MVRRPTHTDVCTHGGRTRSRQTGLLAKGRAQRPRTSMHVHTDGHEQQRHTQIIHTQRDRHTRTHRPLQTHIQTTQTADMQRHTPPQSEVCVQVESRAETHAPLTKLDASDVRKFRQPNPESPPTPTSSHRGRGWGPPRHAHTHAHIHTPQVVKLSLLSQIKPKHCEEEEPKREREPNAGNEKLNQGPHFLLGLGFFPSFSSTPIPLLGWPAQWRHRCSRCSRLLPLPRRKKTLEPEQGNQPSPL